MFSLQLLSFVKIFSVVTIALVLTNCGGGGSSSGASVQQNDNPNAGVNSGPAPSFKNYEGVAPRDDDVQNFRLHFWSRLAGNDRCGSCHIVGGAAANLPFARDDNINLAYDAIINGINKSVPSASLPVTTVAGGHQGADGCWYGATSADFARCASDITNYILSWVNASTPTSLLAALKANAPDAYASAEPFAGGAEVSDGDPTHPYSIRAGKRFSTSTPASFSALHTTLQTYCSGCHTPNAPARQQPYFAVSDADVAYQAIQTKVDLNDTTNSRLYVRLSQESHNCWDDCDTNASDLLDDINVMVNSFSDVELESSLQAVASRGSVLSQGFILSNGSRVDDSAVGLWRFAEGTGTIAGNAGTALITNGVLRGSRTPLELDLVLSGEVEWWGSGGVRLLGGKLQATADQSKALFDNIQASGEYSIESWLVPLNVTQGENDPATIVSYNKAEDLRNFMLSQQLYNYNFFNRNALPNASIADIRAGEPDLSTPDAEEVAQASLQHVVVTYNAASGRRIYVNGELIVEENDPTLAGNFSEWQSDYSLIVGNELSNDREWQGSVRLLAIHDKSLSEDDVQTNFDIGVGDKYYLMLPITHLTEADLPGTDTYIVFRVEEFDQYSYLFTNPIFYSTDETVDISGLSLQGLRIGINSREAESGQAYININTTVDSSSNQFSVDRDENGNLLSNGGMMPLSSVGTLVPKEFGFNPSAPNSSDQFFATFDRIASTSYARPTVIYDEPVIAADDVTEQSDIGLKNFAEVNASLASLTGISETDNRLRSDATPLTPGNDFGGDYIYNVVKQQMSTNENPETFVSANQMAISQLAFAYCGALTDEDSSGVPVFFSGFNFSATVNAAFGSSAAPNNVGRGQIITPLLTQLLADDSGTATNDQPTADIGGGSGTYETLDSLIDELVDNANATTTDIVTATCTAAFGSAMMLIQ